MLLVSQRLDAPRMEPLLPGSVKRKLAADEGLKALNGVSGSHMIQGSSKRPCLEDVTLAMGPSHQHSPFSPAPAGVGGHGPLLEGNGLNSNDGLGSPYSVPPKASPGSITGGGGSGATAHGGMLSSFDPNGNGSAPSVEQELQDILDELTKNPDPSLSELDIEKILGNKGDEQAGSPGGFVQPEGSGTPKRSPQRPSHLESHLTRSPGFSQTPAVAVGSSQVGPPPAGAPYSLPHPTKAVPSPLSASPLSSSAQSHSQSQARSPMLSAALSNRPGPTWREVSRVQQLQQMASNGKLLPSSAGPSPSQPAPSPAATQAAPWTGPSPPYRPAEKLPNSSPHQQPFSPAGNTQSPQNGLMSGMGAAPPKGPSPPYRPEKLGSPALVQPPFSPQSALLAGMASAGGGSGAIQSSQATAVLPVMPPAAGGTRPSPPYRPPDKHPGPTLPPPPQAHAFASHGEPGGMAGQLFKAMSSSQPASLKLLMQQQQNQAAAQPPGQASSTPQQALGKASMAQDPYSFSNTKPLRHFDPPLPAQKPSALPPGQGTLSHYPNLQPGPAAVTPGHPQLLQPQQQEMQQQRMSRTMQAGGMVAVSRVDQGSGMVSRPQDPSSIARPTQGTSYNLMLKNQLIRKQLMQEKQRQLEQQMNGNPVPECHQVAQFQGAGRPHPTECGYPLGAPSANTGTLPQGPMLPGRVAVPQGPQSQATRTVGPFMGCPGPKQVLYSPSQPTEFGMPLQPGQNVMGMGAPTRQPVHHIPGRAGMQGPSFPGGTLQPPPPQHLRHALQQGGALPRLAFSSQQQPQMQAWQQQGLPRMPCDAHMDAGLQQQPFAGGGGGGGGGGGPHQFSQQAMRANMPGSFAPHQTVAPAPSQLAQVLPGRHVQKMPPGQPLVSGPSVSPSGLRPRGPPSAMAGMKPVLPGMVHPAQGMAPPSYSSSSSSKHIPGPGYGGTNPGHKTTPYECAHRQNNGIMAEGQGGASAEVDFIDTLVGSNEDWLNNLTMIDEYLEQNS